jgi:hypothetical protein
VLPDDQDLIGLGISFVLQSSALATMGDIPFVGLIAFQIGNVSLYLNLSMAELTALGNKELPALSQAFSGSNSTTEII